MARRKKEFNKDAAFPVRFRTLCYEAGNSQLALSKALGVSRPTISGWLDGKAVPDILSLKKIANFFNVSADYLLGLSDAASPDVSLRAAATYTGLSEAAVQALHNGLDNVKCDWEPDMEQETEPDSDTMTKKNLSAASALIESDNFSNMVTYLEEVAETVYWKKFLSLLKEKYCEDDPNNSSDLFCFASPDNRNFVKKCMSYLHQTQTYFVPRKELEEISNMDDDSLMDYVYSSLFNFKQHADVAQFHAAKALTDYITQIISTSASTAKDYFRK